MKRLLMILIFAASVAMGDEIVVISVSYTNGLREMTMQYVTRSGVTNSTKGTITKGGKITSVCHELIYNGGRIVSVMETTNGMTWMTATGLPFSVGVSYDARRNPASVSFSDARAYTLNRYIYTNGLFVPVSIAELKALNDRYEKAYESHIKPIFGDLIEIAGGSAPEKGDDHRQSKAQEADASHEDGRPQPQR